MRPHNSFDIKHKMLRFDSQRVKHKNAPHTGDRFVIVCFNTDLNYKTETEEWWKDRGDQRSLRLKQEYCDRKEEYLPLRNVDAEREVLLHLLNGLSTTESMTLPLAQFARLSPTLTWEWYGAIRLISFPSAV